MRRDLDHLHSQRFEQQKRAEVGGRFDGHQVAGLRHRAQAKVQGFGGAAGDDDFLRRQSAAPVERTARHLAPQLVKARWEVVAVDLAPRPADQSPEQPVHLGSRQQFGRRTGSAEGDDLGIRHRLQHPRNQTADADPRGRPPRRRGARLRRQVVAPGTHVEPGLRPRFDVAAAFEQRVRLQDGRYADALLHADAAHGRHPLAGPQHALVDQPGDLARDAAVEERLRFLVH